MPDLSGSARRLYRRLVGVPPTAPGARAGEPSAETGLDAVEVAERFISDATDSLSEAMGLALSGVRATAFLDGADLARGTAALAQAAGRRVPMVLHVTATALPGAGERVGSGHAGLFAAADAGALVLVAANAQEAVDFSLIARQVAEEALLPAVVAMDAAETALALQDLRMPAPDLIEAILGRANAVRHAPTPSQELLFGQHRLRLPRRHDLERPVLNGAVQRADTFALGEAGRAAYFDPHVPAILEQAFERFYKETGRRHAAVSSHHVEDATLVLVAMGSVIEAAELAADHLRHRHKVKVGVIGLRTLRPFPAEALAALLGGKTVAVLERVSLPLGAEAPLVRELRSTVERAIENGRYGKEAHPGAGVLSEKDRPRLVSVLAGLGGFPVRLQDLEALCLQLDKAPTSPVFLGLDLTSAASPYPKRQVLHDALKRGYPQAARLGLRSKDAPPDLLPKGGVVIQVSSLAGQGGEGQAREAALLLHQLFGGHLRVRSAFPAERFDTIVEERLIHAPIPLKDPGDDLRAHLAVWAAPAGIAVPADFADRVRDDGAILFEHDASIGSVWKTLPARVRGDILRRKLHLFTAKGYEAPGTPEPLDASTLRDERMLGAVFGALNTLGVVVINPRKLLAARRKLFEDAPEAETDARIRELQAGFDFAARVETTGLPAPTAGEEVVVEAEPPASVRRAGHVDETVDSLPRFWDQVGVPESEGAGGGFHPDPYFATGTLPALSSSFHDVSRGRRMLPAFDAARCTGCGACWSGCPDSALAAGVWSPSVFVERGMALAARSGRSAEGLRMTLGKFAARVGEELAASATPGIGAGALLDAAFAHVTSKMTLTEDRRKGVEDAFRAVRDAVGALPVTRTQVFFEEPEATAKGSGELFSLAINPDACKGCGLCVTVCEPEALTRAAEEPARAAASREGWRLLHELPEPSEAACARAREHAEVGPLAAAMLRREANLAMIGGDGAEAGSGEKIALRQILGIALDAIAPAVNQYVAEIEELRVKLSEAIREGLASALPTTDLDALADGLDAMGRPDTDLAALTARVETAFETGRVDVLRMRRLVDVARDLADLHQRLTVGATGAGVAKFGLVLAPSADAGWVGAFPNNPFGVPVTLRGEADGLALARGVLEGQLRQALDGMRTVRRARLEVERPSEAAVAGASLARLTWRDLTAEERRACPPLFFVADETALAGDAIAGFAELLNDDLPVKAVLLAEASFRREIGISQGGGARGTKPAPAAPEFGLLALAGSRALVVQSSIAHSRHLAAGVTAAVLHDGPAVVRVYAPSPERHGFAPDRTLERAQGAVLSRTCPLFTAAHDPVGGSALRVSVDGNPDPAAIWSTDADGNAVTPASWARGERRLSGHLSPVAGNASEPTPLAEYLALSAEDREDKTPVVIGPDGTFQVDPALVGAAGERLAAWRTLQALAGMGAPRVEPAEADIEALATKEIEHAAQVDALRRDYEARLANQQYQLKAELARQIRTKLMTIVSRPSGNGGDEV